MAMLSSTEPANSCTSCGTQPICARSCAGDRWATSVSSTSTRPARRLVQALHEVGDGGLARARRADDADDLAAGDREIGVAQQVAAPVVGARQRDALQADSAAERRHRRQARRARALAGSAISSSRRSKAMPRRLQLVPGRRDLAHRLQRARRQEIGGDQAADRERAGDDLVHADQHDGEQREEMQAGRGADGDVGELAGAEVAGQAARSTRACQRFSTSASRPSALTVAALATVSVSAELLAASAWKYSSASRRKARWVRTGTATSSGIASTATMPSSDVDREQRQQEQHGEDEVDRERRQLAGDEAAQHVELAQTLGDHARRIALEVAIGKPHQMVHGLRCSSACRDAPPCVPTSNLAPAAAPSRAHRRRAGRQTKP